MKIESYGDDIVLRINDEKVWYKEMLGFREGKFRDYTTVNGKPAIFVGGKARSYYTLIPVGRKILVDCVIFEDRHQYVGVKMSGSVCGLNRQLSERYVDIGDQYGNLWFEKLAGLDISKVISKKGPLDYKTGELAGIEIREHYATEADLASATPLVYLKKNGKCHHFDNKSIFVNYQLPKLDAPASIFVLSDEENFSYDALGSREIQELIFNLCDF